MYHELAGAEVFSERPLNSDAGVVSRLRDVRVATLAGGPVGGRRDGR